MDIGHLITNIANGTRQRFDHFFAQYDLTYPQYRCLMWMFRQDAPVNQQALCAALCIKASSVSSLIRNLEKKGYVRREPNSQDRRNWNLILTDKALELQSRIEVATENGERQLLTGLTPAQVETARIVLEQILQNLEDGQG